jgi:hypothetical protein
MPTWLEKEPVHDYRTMSQSELLALWTQHRNDPVGLMAADEVCYRLTHERESPVPDKEQRPGALRGDVCERP